MCVTGSSRKPVARNEGRELSGGYVTEALTQVGFAQKRSLR